MISTNDWSTGFFLFVIGLFQGCVLSTILFNCVFQLLLDFLHPKKYLGYVFKSLPSIQSFNKAYADDLSLITTNTKDMQIAVDCTNNWLNWSQTMKAKPSKCVSLGFKLFDKRIKNETFTPYSDTLYAPFDPGLKIAGQPMKFIISSSLQDSFKAKHFKFLGRWINPMLNEKEIKHQISRKFEDDINLIQKAKVNGFMKLWLYQFYVIPRLSWQFPINDLDKSFSIELQRHVNVVLKKWAGIGLSVDNGILFRSKSNFGLGLTSVPIIFSECRLSNGIC